MVLRYAPVSLGDYALIVHHDANTNDALDRPYFNLPLEPYGYSNGAWTSFGLPSWPDVRFTVSEHRTKQTVTLRTNAFVVAGKVSVIGIPLLLIGVVVVLWRRRRSTELNT